MRKYRKKPVVVEAVQWTGDNFDELADLVDGLEGRAIYDESDMSLKIKTLEGTMTALPGDYIIKGIHGEIYPCKPDIFEKTYDLITSEIAGKANDYSEKLTELEQSLLFEKRLHQFYREQRLIAWEKAAEFKKALDLALPYVDCSDLSIDCENRIPGTTCEECKREYFLGLARATLEEHNCTLPD